MASPDPPAPHFLFVTCALHGHMNPVRRLAARVAAANPSARVTLSTSVSGHRLMFPSLASPDEEVVDDGGGVLYAPYSDGYDEGLDLDAGRALARGTLSAVVSRVGVGGRPVTRVVYTFLAGWALDVARAHRLPAALYWIQPAAVFAVYHHFFHHHELPALDTEALPSIVSATSPEHPMHMALQQFRHLFADLDAHRPKVLVNTFDALEPEALRAVPELEVVAVCPAVPDDMFQSQAGVDDGNRDGCVYMGWLDAQAPRSVVYVSFGSFVPMSKRQEAEMERGLEATARPYLWARKGAEEQDQGGTGGKEGQQQGMVVGWCDQVRVLSHRAVGCFVTHCGWNSALESVACGVPVVAVPQWTDQPTVAWLLAERAGVGVRAQVAGDEGVVGPAELRRCVEAVMGAADIRARVDRWRDLAREAVAAGGSSERNLRAFASGR